MTRLDLTLHFRLVTHIGVANAFSGFCKDTHTHTRAHARAHTHTHNDGSRKAKLGMH